MKRRETAYKILESFDFSPFGRFVDSSDGWEIHDGVWKKLVYIDTGEETTTLSIFAVEFFRGTDDVYQVRYTFIRK